MWVYAKSRGDLRTFVGTPPTIVGDRGRGDTPNSSDGVVAYWSSHLTGAKSELIVPGPHGSYALPQTVSELKRILRLNLTVVSAPHRNTMPKASVRLAAPAASGQIARLHKIKILPSV